MNLTKHKFIVVNPGHGNEPTRLGIEISIQMLSVFQADIIVVPDISNRISMLVKKEFPDQPIILSRELGDFYKSFLTDISSFIGHLRNLQTDRHNFEAAVRRVLREGFVGETLEGVPVQIKTDQVVLEVITGSRILATDAPTIFAFQGLLTSILDRALSEDLIFKDQDSKVVMKVYEEMLSVESKYDFVFIPNTSPFIDNNLFTHLSRPPFITPPLRRFKLYPQREFFIHTPSIFVMVSGTGRTKNIDHIAQSLNLPYVVSEFGDATTSKERVDPVEIFGSNIMAVLTRGGAGTHWLCQHARKPQIFLPFQQDDDPEIFFNLHKFIELGVGIMFDGKPISKDKLNICIKCIRALNIKTIADYKTLDGINFIHDVVISSQTD